MEYAIRFGEVILGILVRRAPTFSKNHVLLSFQVLQGKRDKLGKCNGPPIFLFILS